MLTVLSSSTFYYEVILCLFQSYQELFSTEKDYALKRFNSLGGLARLGNLSGENIACVVFIILME